MEKFLNLFRRKTMVVTSKEFWQKYAKLEGFEMLPGTMVMKGRYVNATYKGKYLIIKNGTNN